MTPLPPITGVASMPFMPSGPIGPIDAAGAAGQAEAPAGTGFANVLSDAISGLNSQLTGSERLAEQVATGRIADPTAALVAVEQADLAFNTAVQVRNKLVEGWQEISRMQV